MVQRPYAIVDKIVSLGDRYRLMILTLLCRCTGPEHLSNGWQMVEVRILTVGVRVYWWAKKARMIPMVTE